MDGERLYKYLKNKGLTQNEMLIKSTFSRAKIYQQFKRARIETRDKLQLIKDFDLPTDFFENANYTGSDPAAAAGNESMLLREIIQQKDEQIKLLNERIADLKKINELLERKLLKK